VRTTSKGGRQNGTIVATGGKKKSWKNFYKGADPPHLTTKKGGKNQVVTRGGEGTQWGGRVRKEPGGGHRLLVWGKRCTSPEVDNTFGWWGG